MSSNLLELPYELRQQILSTCLTQNGTIELQHPLWAGPDAFAEPLFYTSRQLRDEALEAFYKSNAFVWVIDVDRTRMTDPSTYPLLPADGTSGSITPALPWHYPKLLQHLRHLRLNIYLPQIEDDYGWLDALRQSLTRMVAAIDHGRRLKTLTVLLSSKHHSARVPLSTEQIDVLKILARMEVPGRVKVATKYDFREVRASIENLQLDKAMRAC